MMHQDTELKEKNSLAAHTSFGGQKGDQEVGRESRKSTDIGVVQNDEGKTFTCRETECSRYT
jgi:hypothetical protein